MSYNIVDENGVVKVYSSGPGQTIEEIIEWAIPIYTDKNPNPKSGQPDCRITKQDKEGFRMIMRKRLEAAVSDHDKANIIEKYKKMFE